MHKGLKYVIDIVCKLMESSWKQKNQKPSHRNGGGSGRLGSALKRTENQFLEERERERKR